MALSGQQDSTAGGEQETAPAAKTALDPALEMLLNELGGKHNAAQVYDERIWKIRTGVLTLAFASWGALLAVGDNLDATVRGAAPMLAVTLALLVGGFAVELFYVRRKYRCTKVINAIGVHLYDLLKSPEPADINREILKRLLRFSGDDKDIKPEDASGYWAAFFESLVIYGLPTLGFIGVHHFLIPGLAQT